MEVIIISLKLPDWTNKRTLRVMAGIELVAYKLPDAKWQMKVSQCNMCGKCCMALKTHKHVFSVIDGKCIHLKKRPGNNPRWECGLRINRPFGCCVATPQNIPECTVKYEEI